MSLLRQPFMSLNDANGNPYVGAKAYFYLTGTTTPTPVYQDAAFSNAWAQPVLTNSEGRFPAIYCPDTPAVRMKIISATGSLGSPLIDIDPITDISTASQTTGENLVVNGNFQINQRAYVSNATLNSGVFGHDRWRAGSGGGDYTYTQLLSGCVVTIKTNKTLIHPVEAKNIVGGTYTLSWTGTASARMGINGSSPSGAYATSPITVTGVNEGQKVSFEFNAGTLGNVKFETGSVSTPFVHDDYKINFDKCWWYYRRWTAAVSSAGLTGAVVSFLASSTTAASGGLDLGIPMRGVPSVTVNGNLRLTDASTGYPITSITSIVRPTPFSVAVVVACSGAGLTVNNAYFVGNNSDTIAYCDADAEI